MKVILTNAFSINMLSSSEAIWFEKISEADARRLIADTFESAVGHVVTANLLSEKLDVQIPVNCVEVKMDKDTVLLVAQLKGRLPEGKVILSLDEMREIPVEFWLVVDNERAGSI